MTGDVAGRLGDQACVAGGCQRAPLLQGLYERDRSIEGLKRGAQAEADRAAAAEAEVDRLETINASLREALASFLAAASTWRGGPPDAVLHLFVTQGDVQRAREALVYEGSGATVAPGDEADDG